MGTRCFHLNIHGLTFSFRPKVKFVKGLKSKCEGKRKKELKEGRRKRLMDVFSLRNVLLSLSL